jgi:pilus assembly protein CpaB
VEDRSRRRARLVLIVGILIAVLAGVATFTLSSGTKTEAPPPVATTDVLVAARDLPARSALTAADIKLQKFPVDLAPTAAIAKPDEVIGKIVQVPLAALEPILPGKFAAAGAASFTVFPPNAQPAAGQSIPPGTPDYRVVALTVTDAMASGGAIQVGDNIDIMLVQNLEVSKFFLGTDPNRVPDFFAKIIMQNVPVLARAASLYTIRTDAQTAEQLAYIAASGGQLQFLLRAGLDQRTVTTQGATFGPVYQRFKYPVSTKIAP